MQVFSFVVGSKDVVEEGERYKFICLVKGDHGQIVLNCVKFKKIGSED